MNVKIQPVPQSEAKRIIVDALKQKGQGTSLHIKSRRRKTDRMNVMFR